MVVVADSSLFLGDGKSEAIVLAREIKADVLLMDERRGRLAAKRLGLIPRYLENGSML